MKKVSVKQGILLWFGLLGLVFSVAGCEGCNNKKEPAPAKESAKEAKIEKPALPEAPDELVKALFKQMDDRNPGMVWEALPAGYQNDINSLVKDFAGKMDKELWDKGFGLLQKASSVAKEKKDFILNTPIVAQQIQAQKKDNLVKGWDGAMAMLSYLANCDLAKLDNLKQFEGGQFIQSMLNDIKSIDKKDMDAVEKLMKAYAVDDADETEKLSDIKVELVKNEGETAVLALTPPKGEKAEVPFVKVEGKWVPKELADAWKASIAEAQEGIAEISGEEMTKNKPQMLAMIAAFESGLDQLGKAKTQKKFDKVLMGLLQGMR